MTHSRDSLIETLCRYMASHNEWRSKAYLTDTMKWKYEEKGIKKTYMAETCGRKLRLLESESRIAVRVKDGGDMVEYKFIPVEHRSRYISFSSREKGKESILFRT